MPAGGPATVIRSATNPRYRALRQLLTDARARKAGRRTVLEGQNLVSAWIARGGGVIDWAVGEAAVAELDSILPGAERLAPPMVLSRRLIEQLSDLPSAAPVLAIIEPPAPVLPAAFVRDLVILDRIQDPGNVGAIIRTVAAAGHPTVVTMQGTAGCWSPKSLRSGMGGQFALTIHEAVDWPSVRGRLRIPLVATVVRGGTPLAASDLRPPLAWWFGNEGEGIDAAAAAQAALRVTIEHSEGVESLNVTAAAAVCLFEQRRQRGG
jgi:TrmH family RNA methyltransferase